MSDTTPPPPPLSSKITTTDAAWTVGITQEALDRLIETSGITHTMDPDGTRRVDLSTLLRLGFTQLGQREAQVAMLRIQLSAALEREQQLLSALQSKLLDDTVSLPAPKPKKGKKKKKR